MSRISGTLSGIDLSVQRNLINASNEMNQSTKRLSTLQRINSGKDDPAGLISVESIRAELEAMEAADRNASRAASAVRVADSGLSQVGSLLNLVEGALVSAAGGGLSDEQTSAMQIEVDAALEAMNRIGSQTNLGGRNLLDGSSG